MAETWIRPMSIWVTWLLVVIVLFFIIWAFVLSAGRSDAGKSGVLPIDLALPAGSSLLIH